MYWTSDVAADEYFIFSKTDIHNGMSTDAI